MSINEVEMKEKEGMEVQHWNFQAAVLILCVVSGLVDVLGYIGLAHVFTANMTGNIVLLGIGLGDARQVVISNALFALLGFVIGILATKIVGKEKGEPRRIVFAEFVWLTIIALCVLFVPASSIWSIVLLVSLSAAMGMQTIAGRNMKVAGVSSTVLTSTLAAFVEGIADWVTRRSQSMIDSYLRGAAILLYLLGAALGSFSERMIGLHSLWVAVILLFAAFLLQKEKSIA
ncbi:YoaK family protein [Terribacillus sp. JSM ZJ617]|uniref:YoaK family protein n=1 Tax=Terribacillus sp. JSM ZJ617 TaxID=3342119 RepID=UPI0035A95492